MRELQGAYERARARMTDLVTGLDDDAAGERVPACPEWSIHDVYAHVTGTCDDVISGNLKGLASEAWTAAQVEKRRGRTLPEILREWNDLGPRVASIADDFPGHTGLVLIAEVTTHEHDLRGALGSPDARGPDEVALALQFYMDVFLHPGLIALGLGPLELASDDMAWLVGRDGPPTGRLDEIWQHALWSVDAVPQAEGAPMGRLAAEPFELLRAISGRRSAAQIRALDWSIDPEPFLPAFGFGPLAIRPHDLIE